MDRTGRGVVWGRVLGSDSPSPTEDSPPIPLIPGPRTVSVLVRVGPETRGRIRETSGVLTGRERASRGTRTDWVPVEVPPLSRRVVGEEDPVGQRHT